MRYIKKFESFKDNMVYRNAKNIDYPDIKRISNQHREYLPFVMRVAIEDSIKRNEVIVCEKDKRVIGFIHFHKRRDGYTTIHEVGVDRNFLSIGIGKNLINMIEKPIQLKVTTDNPANDFYKKLGFRFIKEIKGNKRNLNLYILD